MHQNETLNPSPDHKTYHGVTTPYAMNLGNYGQIMDPTRQHNQLPALVYDQLAHGCPDTDTQYYSGRSNYDVSDAVAAHMATNWRCTLSDALAQTGNSEKAALHQAVIKPAKTAHDTTMQQLAGTILQPMLVDHGAGWDHLSATLATPFMGAMPARVSGNSTTIHVAIIAPNMTDTCVDTIFSGGQAPRFELNYMRLRVPLNHVETSLRNLQILPALGGCHARLHPAQPTSYILYAIAAEHFTTENIRNWHKTPPQLGTKVYHGHATPIGTCATTLYELPDILSTHAATRQQLVFAATRTLQHSGRSFGGDSSMVAVGLEVPDFDANMMLAPHHTALTKIVLEQSDLATNFDPAAASGASAASIKDGWSTIITPPFTINNEGIDATGLLIGTNRKHEERHARPAGAVISPLRLHAASISWATAPARTRPLLEMAPAFSAVTAVWLDRMAVQAITQAANWLGSTRTMELEPIVRNAMRVAAVTPMDFTRYYVRLLALYYDCLFAEQNGDHLTVYHKTPSNARLTVIASYNEWAAALCLAVREGACPIYLDSTSMFAVEDILDVLATVVGPPPCAGALSSWLWPAIPGAKLYTNSNVMPASVGALHSATVAAAMSWLADSTETQPQHAYAYTLINGLAYRPRGCGLLGPASNKARYTIALPQCVTLAQLLAPLSLWASTQGGRPCNITPEQTPQQQLLSLGIAGTEYHYAVTMAVASTRQPEWWPRKYKFITKNYATSQLLKLRSGWLPALKAIAGLLKSRKEASFYAASYLWPTDQKTLNMIQTAPKPSCTTMLTWRRDVSPDDALAAEIAKVTVVTQPNAMPIGGLMRVEQLATNPNSAVLSYLLRTCGVQVGIGFYNMSTFSLDQVCWAPTHAVAPEVQHYANQTGLYSLHTMVRVPTYQSYMALLAAIEATNDTTWYIMAAEAIGPQPPFNSAAEHDAQPPALPQPTPAGAPPGLATTGLPQTSRPSSPPTTDDADSDGASDDAYIQAPLPSALQAVTKTYHDQVIATLVDRATGGTTYVAPAMEKLHEWEIPASLAGDDQVLEWLALALPKYFSARGDSQVDRRVDTLRLNISEQLRLNAERRTAASQVLLGQHLHDPPGFIQAVEASQPAGMDQPPLNEAAAGEGTEAPAATDPSVPPQASTYMPSGSVPTQQPLTSSPQGPAAAASAVPTLLLAISD